MSIIVVFLYSLVVVVSLLLIGLVLITHPFSSKEMRKRVYPKVVRSRIKMNGIILILIGLPFLLLTGTWLSL